MGTRYINGLGKLAAYFDEATVAHKIALDTAAKQMSKILVMRVKKVVGDPNKLADLAKATQDERVRLGYAPNEPLKRDGRLLLRSIKPVFNRTVEGAVAGAATAEIVFLYHEYGYLNARTGTQVPARSAFREGGNDALAEVEALIVATCKATFGFGALTTSVLPDGNY